MNITVKKTVKDGQICFRYELDGRIVPRQWNRYNYKEEESPSYAGMHELLGKFLSCSSSRTDWNGATLFSEVLRRVRLGEYELSDLADDAPLFGVFEGQDTPVERGRKLIQRVDVIRKWIADCARRDEESSGNASFELDSTEAVKTARETGSTILIRTRGGELVEI